MAIKKDSVVWEGKDADGNWIARADLLCDSESDVQTMGTVCQNVEGLPNGTILSKFSTAFTSDKVLGVLDSNGNWKF